MNPTVLTADQLSREECLRLLETVSVGRVVFSDSALPAAQPVNFVTLEDGIVFGLRRNSPVAAAAEGDVVGFEADACDEAHQTAWTVLVVRHVEETTDPESLGARARRGTWPWAGDASER